MKHRCVAIVVAMCAAAGSAQSPAGTPVAIDFLVTSDKGEPVTDLRPSEVVLKVGGKERKIRSLDLVTHASAIRAETPAPPSRLPPPYAVTGAADAGHVRHVMILLDEAAIAFGAEQPVKDGVARLLAALSPKDRVGLISLQPKGAQIGYTTQREPLQAVVNALVGGRSVPDACPTRVILETLKSVVATTPQGLSSTIFVISAGLAGPGQRGAGPGVGGCQIRADEFKAVENLIDRSQAAVYTVHVGISLSQALNNLAGSIGAENALLSFGDATALERALATTATYYRAAYDPEPSERTRPPQRVDLRVSRQSTRVRAPGQVAPTASSGGTAAVLLRSSSTHGGVPLRSAAFPSNHPGGKVKMVVLFEPVDPAVTLASAIVAAFDEDGEVAAQTTLRAADLASRPIVAALPVGAGSYRVRVAATDASGRGGTVDEQVRAALPSAGSVKTSGLLFGTRQNGAFAPRLEFSTEPAGVAYLEIYSGTADGPISVVFELADAPDGAARERFPGTVQRGSADTHIATAEFPLSSLPAGDVIMRAVVSVGGQRAGTVVRTLRKAGR